MLSLEKTPPLRNLTVLPLMLSPERDEDLLRLTENRVPAFTHDLVPDYLRTKPEPEVEQKMIQLEMKAGNLTYEAAQVLKIKLFFFQYFNHFTFSETSSSIYKSSQSHL